MKIKIIKFIPAALFLFSANFSCAAAYDFYVDAGSAESQESGTENFPFKTINAAISHMGNNDLEGKTVFVKKGIYAESVDISGDTNLIGESRDETILDADNEINALNFKSTKSEVRNMTVKNAEASNIIVDKWSKATIMDCSVENAGKFWIEVKEASRNKKYEFILKNSKVSESGSQGLYILKRKIAVSDSNILNNNEEGIDLHEGVKGTISGNEIRGNRESGIESILGGANLTFGGNHFENNHTQGLTVQVHSTRTGKVKIMKNTFKGNHHYGIRFANYTSSVNPKKFRQLVAKKIKLSKNSFGDNDQGKIAYE